MEDGDSSNDNDISVGGKKSNGHKMDCKCPICKNMMYKTLKKKSKKGGQGETDSDNQMLEGGKKNKSKKSNGHKMDCKCPICKNMMKKKGGQPDPKDKSDSDSDSKEEPKDSNIDDAKTTKVEVDSSKKDDSDSMDSSSMDSDEAASPGHNRNSEGNAPSGRGGRRRTKKNKKSRKSRKTKKSRKSKKSKKSRK